MSIFGHRECQLPVLIKEVKAMSNKEALAMVRKNELSLDLV